MFGIGPMELVLILVVALLVLGPKRMPELARTLGRGLGEFRRASNDLRQSLALDDLQNDLRDGLTGASTIKKPSQDRPAQAGDDLAPGTKDPAATDPEGDQAEADGEAGAGDALDDAKDAHENPEAPRTHPGELPQDMDPHTHHDSSDTSNTSDTSDASDASDAPSATPTPADSELGNVPVGGARATGPAPPRRTDPERG